MNRKEFGFMVRRTRKNNGNVLVLIIVITALIVVPLLLVFSQTGFYVMDRERVQSSVDAACLIAANDMSRIIINDPTFGWVSLSNYPPIGKATKALDGEPLPVTGINTLVGTIRQNTIIAGELANEKMRELADRDRSSLEMTIAELNVTLKEALGGADGSNWIDINGAEVRPVKDVEAFLRAHLPANTRLESLTMTTGWLNGGGITTIEVPKPEEFAQLKPKQSQAGNYKPFVDVPANNRNFTFAGLGPSSRLVSHSEFQPADGKHINSIVRIECVVARQNPYLPFFPVGNEAGARMKCVAYAQPFTIDDVGPKGIMTLRFSGQPVPGLQSWSDFLRPGNFEDRQVTAFDVTGGDFPIDKGSIMAQVESDGGTAGQFAEHLYYWLRNGHLQPKLGAVLDMVNAQFKPGPSEQFAYEFAKDGSISCRVLYKDPFPIGVTADSQSSTMVDTRIQGGLSPVIIFRDNVKHLGTSSGGKHGGQPLAGYPLNWCELRDYGGDEQTARALGKGKLGTQLTVVDQNALPPDANDMFTEIFRKLDGKALTVQPRRSFYSGGLALDIEIGGIRDFQPSVLDIPSKRKYWANRKI
jgi:hypothetical protein